MKTRLFILIGQLVKFILRILGKSGSALPVLVIEKFDKNFIKKIFKDKTVVVISGTNGKTTTAKITTSILGNYFKVFSNKTGSNFTRGIISEYISLKDRNFEVAVLELDEARAMSFIEKVPPTYSILLNVLRDQLDRFGEIDKTFSYLKEIASKTTKTVFINKCDKLLNTVSNTVSKKKIKYFAYEESLNKYFSSDEELYSFEIQPKNSKNSKDNKVFTTNNLDLGNDTILHDYSNGKALITIDSIKTSFDFNLNGIHNALNLAASLSFLKEILNKKFDFSLIKENIKTINPAFGRSEEIKYKDSLIRIILVKNPGGFNVALKSLVTKQRKVVIALNDNFQDGRDVSWIYDVDFSNLENVYAVLGSRSYDMALRLYYDDIEIEKVFTDESDFVSYLLKNEDTNVDIFTTYTAMLKIRKELSKKIDLKEVI